MPDLGEFTYLIDEREMTLDGRLVIVLLQL